MPVQDIYRAVLDFNRERVIELVDSEFAGGTDVSTILHDGLIAPMDEVGRRFSKAEMFIPEMLMAAEAMKAGLEMLRPLLSSTDGKPRGTVVIGTVNNTFGVEFLEAIELIMKNFDGVHTICGLSNISFGLPKREFLNQTFVIMAISKGLDAAIINPLDAKMSANICAAETLLGKDPYCAAYLKAFRAQKFQF